MLLGFCAGCREIGGAEAQRASFRRYGPATIAGERAEDYLSARCAMLLAGFRVDLSSDGHFRFAGGNRSFTCGSAAAIDRRGYYATCAHCLRDAPLTLLGVDAQGRYFSAPVRVVWKGSPGPDVWPFAKHFDFAIVAIPRRIDHVFTWARQRPANITVLTYGLAYTQAKGASFFFVPAAGQVLSWSRLNGPTAAEFTLTNTAPGHPGDSGSPVCTLDGGLLGVQAGGTGLIDWGNRVYTLPPLQPASKAICPNPGWVRRIIDADFAAHGPAAAVTCGGRQISRTGPAAAPPSRS